MADDNKIILKIQVEKGGSTATLKNFENQVLKSGVAIKDLSNSLGNFTTSRLKMDGQVKVTTDQFKRLEKSVGGFKTATGASTSATLELGRVLSDMPYGIRGVANNLQQLASNLFFMSKATDAATGKSVGFMGAIGNVVKGLIGPAGILIAFQGVIALLDYFKVGMDSASSSASDFRGDLENLVDTLDDLYISQANTNDKILEYIEYRALAKKSDEELKELTEDLADLTEDIADKRRINSEFELLFSKKTKGITIEQYKALSEQEKLEVRRIAQWGNLTKRLGDYEQRAIKVSELDAKRLETYKKNISVIRKLKEEQDKLSAAEKDSLKGLKNTLKDQQLKRETLSKTSEKYKELTKDINETQKAIEAIEGKKTKGGKGSKISPFKTGKELELDVKSNEAILLSYSNKIKVQQLKNSQSEELLSAKTSKEKDVIKRKYQEKFLKLQLDNEFETLKLKKKTEKEVLEGKYKTFQEEAKLRLLAYEDSIKKNDKLSKAQKDSLIGSARTDTSKLLSDSVEERNKELGKGGTFETKYESIFKMFNKLKKVRLDAFGIGSKDGEEGTDENSELNKISLYIESYKTLMSGLTEFLGGEFDRQLAIEQNKTNVLNKELNDRLINENLSAEQRKSIQGEIAKNDERLRVKQDAINKKKFNQTKALNLSMALIDTFAGATQVLADKKLPSIAKIPMMASIIGAGLAQVAAISRQKFQSSSANTPINTTGGGGATSTSERSEPSFNIVGRSGENLLINAIQAQFGKPLKAYVVSRDVTTQQQLDGMIVGQAGT
jgi:hypothetical protein